MDPRARRFNPAGAELLQVDPLRELAAVRRLLPAVAADLARFGPKHIDRYRWARRQYRALQQRERDLSASCGEPPLVPADREAVLTWPQI